MSMETVSTVESVKTFETRGGNTRYVLRDDEGKEYTTFRPEIGEQALKAEGRKARLEFHEQQRGEFLNVYLDKVEPVQAEGADSDPEEAAWRTAVDAAPFLVEGETPVDADELFDELKPFKDRVAEDIRTTTDD
jgi:hypothetical protein